MVRKSCFGGESTAEVGVSDHAPVGGEARPGIRAEIGKAGDGLVGAGGTRASCGRSKKSG